MWKPEWVSQTWGMIKAQKCFNLGWLGRKTELLRRVGGKELSFVLAVIVSSIGKRLWLISSGQRSWKSGWKVQPGHLVTILMNMPSAQQRTQIREKPTRIRRKNWLSSMAFLKILKAWKEEFWGIHEVLRSKIPPLRTVRNAGEGVKVNKTEELKMITI